MTFHLVHSDTNVLLTSDRAVIKRDERVAFTDAVALLHAATAIRTRTAAEADAARAEGRAEGLAEARAQAEAELAARIVDFAAAIDRHEAARRGEVADAAYAAVRAILGELDDEALVTRMAARTLDRLPDSGPVTVLVAPEMAAQLRERLAALEHVAVAEDAGLGATDCVLRTPAGQVIAGLSTQLDALARRWGVAT